ncbi:MAG: recombinase family protein [Desulfobacteraceae bacterium]|nr:recombinase family protein [Desulfobacteraceae bacterium]
MKRCGLYTRVSTKIQAETKEGSLKVQRQRLEAFVNSRNADEEWKVYKIYEETQSGKNMERALLQTLLEDIRNKKIGVVLCTKIDRISRSLLDFYYLYKAFEENGVDFICLDDSFDTSTPIGRMALKMILVFAELEREQTSERTKKCMHQRALKGLWNGGHILGYDLDSENKGYLKVNEQEGILIKTIFESYLRTNSLRKTCKLLNDKGCTTKSFVSRKGLLHAGIKFRSQFLSSLLANYIYIGKLEVNKRNKCKKQEDLPEEKRYRIVEGKQKPILDEKLFYSVQERIHQNKRKPPPHKPVGQYEYLFRRMINCGQCGFPLMKKWAGGNGGYYFYYSCICFKHYIPAQKIETRIIQALKDFMQCRKQHSNISIELGQLNLNIIEKFMHKLQRAHLHNHRVNILQRMVNRINYYEDKIEVLMR